MVAMLMSGAILKQRVEGVVLLLSLGDLGVSTGDRVEGVASGGRRLGVHVVLVCHLVLHELGLLVTR